MLGNVGVIPSAEDLPTKNDMYQWLDVQNSPWIDVYDVTVPLGALDEPVPTGCTFDQCSRMCRPFVADIHRGFRSMTKTATRQKFLKSYVVAVNEEPVFTTEELHQKIAFYQNYDDPPDALTFRLAPERA